MLNFMHSPGTMKSKPTFPKDTQKQPKKLFKKHFHRINLMNLNEKKLLKITAN